MPSIRTCNNRRRFKVLRRPLPAAILVPNGFEPRDAELGETVKIGFRAKGSEQTEWMWGDIVEKDGSNYIVTMLNTAFDCDMREGSRVAITSANILTTYDDCPLRAAADLEPLGGSWIERIEMLRAVEQQTGLGRRDAVAKILADLQKAT